MFLVLTRQICYTTERGQWKKENTYDFSSMPLDSLLTHIQLNPQLIVDCISTLAPPVVITFEILKTAIHQLLRNKYKFPLIPSHLSIDRASNIKFIKLSTFINLSSYFSRPPSLTIALPPISLAPKFKAFLTHSGSSYISIV